MACAASKEVTTKQIKAISFGFYTDSEVRNVAVKQIYNPITFDNLKNPLPHGLYDPAMGPVDNFGRCETCKLTSAMCPGHFGYIQLPMPVYNPIIFPALQKVLKTVCLHCHRFKMKSTDVDAYLQKLQRLAAGDLVGAMAVSSSTLSKQLSTIMDVADTGKRSRKKGPDVEDKMLEQLGASLKATDKASAPAATIRPMGPITSHTLEAMQDTIGDFFRSTPSAKCQNCGAHAPKIRKYAKTRLFMVWTSKRALIANKTQNTVIRPYFNSDQAVHTMESTVATELAQQAMSRKAKAKPGAGGAGVQKDEDDEDEAELGAYGGKKEDAAEDLDVGPIARDTVQDTDSADVNFTATYMDPSMVLDVLRQLWAKEWPLLRLLFASEGAPRGVPISAATAAEGYNLFFLRVLPVAPNRFRPPSKIGDDLFDHAHNVILTKILTSTLDAMDPAKAVPKVQLTGNAKVDAENKEAASVAADRLVKQWLAIQDAVCELIDSTVAEKGGDGQGIRQTLEKKEGLFRKNMMGKRVNFAARSVISPDPYIGAGEIGVPPFFAMRLSFPERVTPFNVERLRRAVIAGAASHPGALGVEYENGTLVNLGSLSLEKREAIAKQLLTTAATRRGKKGIAGGGELLGGGADGQEGAQAVAAARRKMNSDVELNGKIVYRHLQDGDLMLTNRQPTLHKPGLMAHKARVLKGERTIRMHYSNCATFNADFDGDEINLHLPQDHYGRAEASIVVHADQQYIVPTDGKPIRGLIQDHVVSGTLLCKRDTFLSKQDYTQLVYAGCTVWMRNRATEPQIHLEPPTILKPRMLWTGKQVVSTVVRHWTWGLPPLTFSAGGKVPADYWGAKSGEDTLYFFRGTLVTGVVDKNQFGKYGLVHAVQELYGNSVAGQLLSSFSRLFTYYLQHHGFTCGIDDLLLVNSCERARQSLLDRAEGIAINASADFVGAPRLDDRVMAEPRKHQQQMIQANIEVCSELASRYRADFAATGVLHDSKATSVMHPLSSEVIKLCLPNGQVKAFPANCLSAMTITGAKGSLVNFSQISCLLGQQELEGRRVPRMASGKTLPCFRAFDSGARSGGFVGDRFLTGLRPQEYYFHCMAGREGLVDTTVKTSRSGYLQRCLVKNLESLRVHYDSTVRDNCDGSVVQFYYGEDGLDVMTTNYMHQFGFLARNTERFAQLLDAQQAVSAPSVAAIADAERDVAQQVATRQGLLQDVAAAAAKPKKQRRLQQQLEATLPVMAVAPPSRLGVTSEKFGDALAAYVSANPDGLLKGADGSAPPSKDWPARFAADQDTFTTLMRLKYMRSLVAAGEAVGVLAAQSVGEPSTQMTLNTFHMAGRGEANVTLGIPRLREILMTASAKIKTPVMTVPIRPERSMEDAQALASRLRRMRLGELLKGITVRESELDTSAQAGVRHTFSIQLQFFSEKQYGPEADVTFDDIVLCFKRAFCPRLKFTIERESRRLGGGIGKVDMSSLGTEESAAQATGGGDEAAPAKKKSEKGEAFEDFDEDEELREGKLRFRGGREEQATYDEPDEEDAQVVAAVDEQYRREDEGSDEDEDDPNNERGLPGTQPQPRAMEGDFDEEAGDQDDEQDEDDDHEEASPIAAVRAAQQVGKPALSKAAKRGPAKAKKGWGSPGKGGKVEVSGIDEDEGVDRASHTCEVVLVLPPHSAKLMMLEIVERVAAETVLRVTDKIDKVYVLKGERGEPTRLQLDGINFPAIWEVSDIADVNRLTTNDVHAMLRTFGVEAARATVMREVQAVFSAYGIGVDPRHLSLIADFMTQQGGYRACNRMSIDRNVSPFLKMSFETATHFLTDATLRGHADNLRSPSARIVTGRVVDLGTGVVELMQQLPAF